MKFEGPIQEILDDARAHMEKTIEHFKHELSHFRAGRATPSMLEDIRVEYYGSRMPLEQVASVNAPSPDLLVIQPWDRSMVGVIEKAIQAANLGLNPSNDGSVIRIPIPPPSEERRKELVKAARLRAEEARVAIRNIRRSHKEQLKKVVKEEHISEDIHRAAEEELQRLTNEYIGKVDKLLAAKEKDIMTV